MDVPGPVLLVVAGLPGVGKSALAEALARALGAAHLSIDPVEEALRGSGVPEDVSGVAAYEAVRAAAETCLAAGVHVVVDAVNDAEVARDTWRRAAAAAGASLRFVVLDLEDAALHRGRLEGRRRPFVRVAEPTWAEVRARPMAPWSDALHLDAALPVAALLDAVLLDQPALIRRP